MNQMLIRNYWIDYEFISHYIFNLFWYVFNTINGYVIGDYMDAFILFVLPPLLGYGIYYVMRNQGKLNDFVQSMIGYVKRKRDK